MPSILSRVDDFFQLDEHNTSIGAELRAGLVAFLSCSYLLLLIPHMLSAHLLVSLPAHAVRVLSWQTCCGVAIASSLGTLVCALLTNWPILLTPGLGLTAYFTSLLLMPPPPASSSLTHALTCSFVSGALLLLLSLLPLHLITRAVIPHSIKLAAMAGLGLLVAVSALTMSGILLALPTGGWTAGRLLSRDSVMALAGLLLVSVLLARGVKGGMMLGVVVMAALWWATAPQLPSVPSIRLPSLLPSTSVDWRSLSLYDSIPAVLSFFLVSVFDITALVHTVAALSPVPLSPSRERFVFLVCGLTSMIGAFYCCPPLIVAVESVVGMKEGGRTGLSAVTASLLLLLSLLLSPLLSLIPPVVTAPLLLLVGSFLFAEASALPLSSSPTRSVPAFLTIAIIPFTSSIALGISLGLVTWLLLRLATGEWWGGAEGEGGAEAEGEEEDSDVAVGAQALYGGGKEDRRPSTGSAAGYDPIDRRGRLEAVL